MPLKLRTAFVLHDKPTNLMELIIKLMVEWLDDAPNKSNHATQYLAYIATHAWDNQVCHYEGKPK